MDGSGSVNSSTSCWTACCCSCPQQQQEGRMNGREVSATPTEGEPGQVIDTQPGSGEPKTNLDERDVSGPVSYDHDAYL